MKLHELERAKGWSEVRVGLLAIAVYAGVIWGVWALGYAILWILPLLGFFAIFAPGVYFVVFGVGRLYCNRDREGRSVGDDREARPADVPVEGHPPAVELARRSE